jgi:hypothetical protein
MTEELEPTTIRELRDDELILVAGAQAMERDAGRYVSPMFGGRALRGLFDQITSEVVSVKNVTCTNVEYSDGSSNTTCVPSSK